MHDRGDFYGDRNVNGPMQHEIVERAKYTAPIQPPGSLSYLVVVNHGYTKVFGVEL